MKKSTTQRGLHEGLDRQESIKGGSNRGFGLTVGGVLMAIAAYRIFASGSPDLFSYVLLAAGSLLVVFGLLFPIWLAPLNRAWTRLGIVMSKVVNPIVLALIFLTTVVPIGLAMRLAGKDPLRLKSDPDAESYWIGREPPGPAPDSIKNQF